MTGETIYRHAKPIVRVALPCALLLGTLAVFGAEASHRSASAAPSTPPAEVCGNSSLLSGPTAAPSGAVLVPAGNNHSVAFNSPDTTYYFESGTHTFGTGDYTQLIAGTGDTYVGAPGAVINGQGDDYFAATGKATGVTLEYLTITDFVGTSQQGVVNHTAASGWTITHDTVSTSSAGAGVEVGSNDTISDSCLTHNGQYGFNAYSTTGTVSNVTLSGNEISFNDGSSTGGGKYDQGGSTIICGCSGGGKFWDTLDATITTNYVHTNGNVGIWVDTDNRGFDISHNYVADNYAEGIMYEVSYNALISDNTLVGNAVHAGPLLSGFPDPAIYISESGGDNRVASNYSGTFTVTGNVFTNNWGGIVLWENSNRYCGDGSDAYCTLVTPSTYTITSCKVHLAASTATQSPDYYDNCRWKTKTVTVSHNTFNFTPSDVASDCTLATNCGFNGLFSEYGTTAPWKGWPVPLHISDDQHNVFEDNTYTGPWHFDGFALGETVTWTKWSSGFTDTAGSGDHFNAQDAGSTYNGTAAAPVTTTTAPPVTTTTAPPVTTTTTGQHPTTTTTDPPTTTTTHPPTTTTTTREHPTTTTTDPPTTTTTHPPVTTTTTNGHNGYTTSGSRPKRKRYHYGHQNGD